MVASSGCYSSRPIEWTPSCRQSEFLQISSSIYLHFEPNPHLVFRGIRPWLVIWIRVDVARTEEHQHFVSFVDLRLGPPNVALGADVSGGHIVHDHVVPLLWSEPIHDWRDLLGVVLVFWQSLWKMWCWSGNECKSRSQHKTSNLCCKTTWFRNNHDTLMLWTLQASTYLKTDLVPLFLPALMTC